MTEIVMQNNFSHGELDEKQFGNVDWAPYYKSAKKLRNVVITKNGAPKKAPGSIMWGKVLYDNFRIFSFIGSGGQHFILIFSTDSIQFYRRFGDNDTRIAYVYTFSTPYTTDELSSMQCQQIEQTLYIVHQNFTPDILTFNGPADTNWTFGQAVFKNLPAFDFRKDYYTTTFLPGAGGIGTGITLTASTAVFVPAHVGGLFISLGPASGISLGVARITAYTSPTVVVMDVLSEFASGFALPGSSSFLGEVAFSDARGWPRAICTYESRLGLGGTKSLPFVSFYSKIGDYLNFDQGDAQEDDAIIYTLTSTKYDPILHMVGDKTLQIFCTSSEHSSMQGFDQPFTATTSSIRQQTDKGSEDVQPVTMDNKTFFVKRGGNEIMAYTLTGNNASGYYESPSASSVSSQLINNPVRMASLIGSEIDDSDYLFVVNGDGSLAIYQSVANQDISAWSLKLTGQDLLDIGNFVPTDGKFVDIVTVANHTYVVVRRVMDGESSLHLEELSFKVYLDCCTWQQTENPTNTVTNLNHLAGINVQINADGFILPPQIVPDDGNITISISAKSVQVGIPIPILIETVPVSIIGSGRLYFPKSICRSFISYYQTNGLYLNGSPIPELSFSSTTLDQPVPLLTGQYDMPTGEWEVDATITIEQNMPIPFLLRGIMLEVAV